MEQLIRTMIHHIHELVVERLPASGDFEPLIEESYVDDNNWKATKIWLKVEQAPKGVEMYEVKRGLYLVATDEERQCHILLAHGTKQELLNKLTDNSFVDYLIDNAERLDDFLLHS